jgi:hypothetical protein
MKTRWIAIAFVAAALWPASARADLASLHAEVHSGGAGGAGLGGDALVQDQAFHQKTQGLTYGAEVGIEFLFIDVWAEHNQFLDTNGDFLGTWTQLMVGLDIQMGVGDTKGGRLDREKGKMVGGYEAGYLEAGFGIGLGFGTLQQVDPPLNNEQIDDKGPVGQAFVGAGYRLNRVLSIGVAAPVQVGYLFKSGVANDTNNQYSSMQYAVMANLRMKFQLK